MEKIGYVAGRIFRVVRWVLLAGVCYLAYQGMTDLRRYDCTGFVKGAVR